jgi:hypothetical protein
MSVSFFRDWGIGGRIVLPVLGLSKWKEGRKFHQPVDYLWKSGKLVEIYPA